jgi:hypothetical protein
VEGVLRHRDVVGEQEAGATLEGLLADGGALAVHHEQLVLRGQFLHEPLEGHRAHADARFDRPRLFLAHATRGIERFRDLAEQGALVEAADLVHGVGFEADRPGEVLRAFQHQVDDDVGAVRLRDEDRVHQRVRQDLGMGLLADACQQLLAVRGCRPGPQYESPHAGQCSGSIC